tara:strand:+ start:164 stop:652 length:489 start_codon:yes stop_codon:yes gene_type:complete
MAIDKKAEERSLDLNEAMNSNLISKFSDRGAASMAGIGSVNRLQYLKAKGAGEGIFKPESFYTDTDNAYTNAILGLYGAKAKRGWAQRGTKAVLADQKNKTKETIDTGRRGLGEKKAASARLSRATGGLLAGSATPAASSLSKGPQLGGDDLLSNGTMLGKK